MIATAILVLVLVMIVAGAMVVARGIPRGRARAPYDEADAEEITEANSQPHTHSILGYSDGRAVRRVRL